MRKCSNSLIIKERQIKKTLNYHFSPTTLAKISNTATHSVHNAVENWMLLHDWWESPADQALWREIWQWQHDPAFRLRSPLQGIHLEAIPKTQKCV